MDFSTVKDSAMLILMFIVFGVPAIAISLRIALKPILEAIVRLRDAKPAAATIETAQRMAALESEIGDLQKEVRRLTEAEAFVRQLGQPGKGVS